MGRPASAATLLRRAAAKRFYTAKERQQQRYTVYIRTPTAKMYTMEVLGAESTASLRSRVKRRNRLPCWCKHQLLQQLPTTDIGVALEDGFTIADCRFELDQILHLVPQQATTDIRIRTLKGNFVKVAVTSGQVLYLEDYNTLDNIGAVSSWKEKNLPGSSSSSVRLDTTDEKKALEDGSQSPSSTSVDTQKSTSKEKDTWEGEH
jgi:hypothetical protein